MSLPTTSWLLWQNEQRRESSDPARFKLVLLKKEKSRAPLPRSEYCPSPVYQHYPTFTLTKMSALVRRGTNPYGLEVMRASGPGQTGAARSFPSECGRQCAPA